MSQKTFRDHLRSSKYREILFLTAVFGISLLIRWIAVDHGFPLLTHPDEGVILVPILKMTELRTLNPGNFNRPNQILYLVNFFYLNIISFLKYDQSFANTFVANQLTFYSYARFLIAVLGSLIPILAYKIGEEIKPRLGIFTSIVFAFFPPYISHSVLVTPDVPITLFTLFVIFFSLRYLKVGDEKYLIIATVFSAINTAEKYPGMISLGLIFLAIIIKSYEKSTSSFKSNLWSAAKKILIYSAIFMFALFIFAPFLFIEYKMVIEALIRESRSTHLGADNLGFFGNMAFYVRSFFRGSNFVALPFLAISLYALIKWKQKTSLVLFYGVTYWISLSILSLHWERWALPMYITPLFLIAAGQYFSLTKFSEKQLIKTTAILITIAFISLQVIASLHTIVVMTFKDTRVASLNYCRQNQINEENSLYEGYTPFYPQGPKKIFKEIPFDDESIEYIILSSSMFGRYYREPQRYDQQIVLYEFVRDNFYLVKRFEPNATDVSIPEMLDDLAYFYKNNIRHLPTKPHYKGPVIEIYQNLEQN